MTMISRPISDFNVTINAGALSQITNWEVPQIKYLKLIMPEHYTFATSNSFFTALDILSNYLILTTFNKPTLDSSTYKNSLDVLPLVHAGT